jgi:hypothetical protein
VTPHLIPRRYAIVEAPSILGLKPTGVDRLPRALLENGLQNVSMPGTPGVLIHSHTATSVIQRPVLLTQAPSPTGVRDSLT